MKCPPKRRAEKSRSCYIDIGSLMCSEVAKRQASVNPLTC